MTSEPPPLQLFSECLLPGCRNPLPETGICPLDAQLFDGSLAGWTIRRSTTGVAETVEEVSARKAAQLAGQARALTPPTPDADVDVDAFEARTPQPEPARGALASSVDAAPTPERKPNQRCWLCEERRACTRRPTGWECDRCLAI